MAAPLRTTSIQAPAFFGLNTMDSEVTLDPKFARSAENCIIDAGGRVGARKGWQYIAQTDPVSTVNLKGLHRFVDINGAEYFGAWSDTSFYIKSASDLNAVTYTGSQTISTGNWQAVTLNDAAYLFQSGYSPIYFNPTTGQLDDVTNAANTALVTISNSHAVDIDNSATVTITHSGTVATVTHTGHNLTTGDSVTISGADQTDYNGTFTVTVTNANVYTYTMSNSPSVDATGTITARTELAYVTHDSAHTFTTGDSVVVSGSTATDYNGTFTITVVSSTVFYYDMGTIPTTEATGNPLLRDDEAEVTQIGHDFITGETVTISGATPTAYNGTFTITVLDTDTYRYTMASVPTTDASGSVQASWLKGTPPQANTALSAYGRVWAADTASNKTTVYWSDLLDGTEWRTTVGTVGSLDITSILVKGNDEIVALGAHNGYLIIFCKNNIIIMGDTSNNDKYLDPTNMQLVEVLNGVGCIARDSVQNTGTDILFLSEGGVRSLNRTVQEKSMPMRDISRNVRNTLIADAYREDEASIKSCYSEHYGFYLLTMPSEKTVYCFDMKQALQDGSARVTRWNNLDHTGWIAFDGNIYMTNTDGIAQYFGYQDNGGSYQMQYYTNYFDFQMQSIVKIVKKIATTVFGSTGQKFLAKVGTDYKDNYSTYDMTVANGVPAEYNIDEYNTTAEYSAGAQVENIQVAAGGSGFVIQLGFESTINGGFLSIQQVDLYVKQGRLN